MKKSPRQLPGDCDGNDPRCAGLIHGGPGTGKSSLVRRMAEELQWPFIPVPASVMFDRGFDGSETRATEVFRLLSYLNRVVIFFDEFEEFFRNRAVPPNTVQEYNHRTIAAYTTAAMLPRLQALHDKASCLVLVATNHPDSIDNAITRPGRFDFELNVDYPTPAVARMYVMGREEYDKKAREAVAKAIDGAFERNALSSQPQPGLQHSSLHDMLRRAHAARADDTADPEKRAKRIADFACELRNNGQAGLLDLNENGCEVPPHPSKPES